MTVKIKSQDDKIEITDFLAKIKLAGGMRGLEHAQDVARAMGIAPNTLSSWVDDPEEAAPKKRKTFNKTERLTMSALVPSTYVQRLANVLAIKRDVLFEKDIRCFEATIRHSPMGSQAWSTLINMGLERSLESGVQGMPIHCAPYQKGEVWVSLITHDPVRDIAGPAIGHIRLKSLQSLPPAHVTRIPNDLQARLIVEAESEFQMVIAQKTPNGWSVLSPTPHLGLQTSSGGTAFFPEEGWGGFDPTTRLAELVVVVIAEKLRLKNLLDEIHRHHNQQETLEQIAATLLENNERDDPKNDFAVLRLQWVQVAGANQ